MNSDKKLKKLIEKSGEELRQSNLSFYERMSAVYDVMPKPEEKKKVPFWRSPAFISVASCCLVFALVLGIVISRFVPSKTDEYQTLDISSSSVIIPSEDIVKTDSQEVVFNILQEKLAKTDEKGTASFGDKTLFLNNYTLLDNFMLKNDTDTEVGSIFSGVGNGSRFQIVIVKSAVSKSKLTESCQEMKLDCDGVSLKYDFIGTKSGMSYFYAEAENGEYRLIVDFMTTLSGEDTFAKFLNEIIK